MPRVKVHVGVVHFKIQMRDLLSQVIPILVLIKVLDRNHVGDIDQLAIVVIAEIWAGGQRSGLDIERAQTWQPVRQAHQGAYFLEIRGGIRRVLPCALRRKRWREQQTENREYE